MHYYYKLHNKMSFLLLLKIIIIHLRIIMDWVIIRGGGRIPVGNGLYLVGGGRIPIGYTSGGWRSGSRWECVLLVGEFGFRWVCNYTFNVRETDSKTLIFRVINAS